MSPRANTSPEPETPNPGSPEAVAAGCVCPVIDNHHGAGYHGHAGMFMVRVQCALHGDTEGESLTL